MSTYKRLDNLLRYIDEEVYYFANEHPTLNDLWNDKVVIKWYDEDYNYNEIEINDVMIILYSNPYVEISKRKVYHRDGTEETDYNIIDKIFSYLYPGG